MRGPGGKTVTEFILSLRPFMYSAEGPGPAGRHHDQISFLKE